MDENEPDYQGFGAPDAIFVQNHANCHVNLDSFVHDIRGDCGHCWRHNIPGHNIRHFEQVMNEDTKLFNHFFEQNGAITIQQFQSSSNLILVFFLKKSHKSIIRFLYN